MGEVYFGAYYKKYPMIMPIKTPIKTFNKGVQNSVSVNRKLI
jgi:hypothetical protein